MASRAATTSDTRVYPSEIEMGAHSSGYHGAAVSTITKEEIGKRREKMTLDQARWSSMRKKIPGMRSVPQELQSRNEYNPELFLANLRTFVRQHFRQKECACYIPKPGQKVKKTIQLQCHCGEILAEHSGMQGPFQNFSTIEMMEDYLIPRELKKYFVRDRRHEPPPENMPKLTWKPDSIRKTATCTYGKINFINVEQIGGKKPAKYIRLSDDDSVENLLELMQKFWRIMEPKKPNLVISVVGGAKNFKLDGRMRDTFSTGLIKAAKTTSAWLISSGFNMGVMKAVGQAVQQGQSFSWDNDRMAHVLRCISIAPWGYVQKRRELESIDGQGKFNANFKTSNVILHGQPVPLNADHTHFIFVDDGYRNRYGGVAEFRARFEQKVSQSEADGGLGIPVVLVVVEGGTDALQDAKKSLEHNIPVVVCAGTGRAADILAYAYSHTKTQQGGERHMKEKHQEKLKDKIYEAYGKSWKEEETDKKTNDIFETVRCCCQKGELMIVFHMNKHEELDLAILSVLLKAKGGGSEEERLNQLNLALKWDRVDIAQEEIFREDVLWGQHSLDDVLTEAIIQDRVKFVELILQQGVVMKEFLTKDKLTVLYRKVPTHNYLHVLVKKLTGRDELDMDNLNRFLNNLLDRYDTIKELQVENELDEKGSDQKVESSKLFLRPYKQLLIYAVLINRQNLAKFCWEMGDEPVTSSIAATRLYGAMARYIPRHESGLKEQILKNKDEFERLATKVLDECHSTDPQKAMMIAERKSPAWNEMTCLQVAASANDQEFLASVTCQNSIGTIWKHGILSTPLKVIVSMFFPPCIVLGLEIMPQLGGNTKMTWFQKIAAFYTSPISKFAHGTLMYFAFLVLFSYMVLVDFRAKTITPIEIVCIVWILTFLMDEIHTFIAFPSPTVVGKIRDWYGLLNWLDLVNFGLAFIGFLLHWVGEYQATKTIYCVNCIIFFVRVLKVYTANANLGPKLVMIKRMLNELRLFIMVLFVFLLAYGVSSQGLLYIERTRGWVILKDVLYFPYWQLYGEIFLEELDSDSDCIDAATNGTTGMVTNCRTFNWLVPFLLAGYLLAGNVLLLNLLIAIFSHVFDTVEENSIEIWKYQMYYLVMEYVNKTALVPPFSLFSHLFLAFRWIFRKTCCKRKREKQSLARRHLEYLQLFEKEMMANYLRRLKAAEKTSLETTVNLLQKRVDELTKLIEDEVIADQPGHAGFEMTTGLQTQKTQLSMADSDQGKKHWPPTGRVLEVKEQKDASVASGAVMQNSGPVQEGISGPTDVKEEEGEVVKKKHKHKHKKKHKKKKEEEKELLVINDIAEVTAQEPVERKISNLNIDVAKPEPQVKDLQPMMLSKEPLFEVRDKPPPAERKMKREETFIMSDSDCNEGPVLPRSPMYRKGRLNLGYIAQEAEGIDSSDEENLTSRRSLSRNIQQNRWQLYDDSDSVEEEERRRSQSLVKRKKKRRKHKRSDTE